MPILSTTDTKDESTPQLKNNPNITQVTKSEDTTFKSKRLHGLSSYYKDSWVYIPKNVTRIDENEEIYKCAGKVLDIESTAKLTSFRKRQALVSIIKSMVDAYEHNIESIAIPLSNNYYNSPKAKRLKKEFPFYTSTYIRQAVNALIKIGYLKNIGFVNNVDMKAVSRFKIIRRPVRARVYINEKAKEGDMVIIRDCDGNDITEAFERDHIIEMERIKRDLRIINMEIKKHWIELMIEVDNAKNDEVVEGGKGVNTYLSYSDNERKVYIARGIVQDHIKRWHKNAYIIVVKEVGDNRRSKYGSYCKEWSDICIARESSIVAGEKEKLRKEISRFHQSFYQSFYHSFYHGILSGRRDKVDIGKSFPTTPITPYIIQRKKVLETMIHISFQALTHRVFNQNSLRCCGRFYSMYQNIPASLRRLITVDGEETIEIDYSSYHIRMLYHKLALKFNTDPYDIPIKHVRKDMRRKVVKFVVNIALNSGEKGAAWTIQKTLIRHYSFYLSLEKINDIIKQVTDSHNQIKEFFFTKVAFELQYIDSCIANEVMLHFARRGEACLCVHDSFIVRKSLENELLETMDRVYSNYFPGFKANFK